ncbi:MAG: EF-hand domain-containing protein [Planctomycetaceae bacterium]|nr:EF-hand domain-containing protein [Planctomycetaceae bacterium]
MSPIRIASITACLSALIFTATAQAAPSEQKDPAARKAEMMKKFDTNKNGTLDPEEKQKLRAEMQNRRGGKDRKEWTPEQRTEMLKKFDKDGDGTLSDTEKATLRAEMQNRRGNTGRKQWTPEERAEMLKKFDKDGDGELNEDERKAARESMRASRGDREGSRKKDN